MFNADALPEPEADASILRINEARITYYTKSHAALVAALGADHPTTRAAADLVVTAKLWHA